ncbi:MAG TPA: nucleotidyltransferase family protein [Thermoanaerobaculia bacterium]|nr:nucleotidyltransferase family protein [Thermoanaerobaculia bacterium]
MKLGAVVLAAGRSRRMGAEKMLLPFGASTVLGTVLDTLARAGVEGANTIVVARPDLAGAEAAASACGSSLIVNPDREAEMMSSIRLGIEALPGVLDAFFVWPADHPAVFPGTVRLLASLADPAASLIPTWKDRRGHPALVGRNLRAAALACPDGGGLRELWRARAEAVREIAVEDPGVVANADTPETYEAALRIWRERI